MTNGFIFDIKRFAVHDGPGIRTTIFFKGCPLSCWWCHNPESRDIAPQESIRHLSLDNRVFEKSEISGYETSVDDLLELVDRDRIYYEESGGGVTLSGGEPLFQPEFCSELLRSLKKSGFHTSLDTTGYAGAEVIQQVTPYTDLFLYDLKLMNDEEHQKYTGVSNNKILENLEYLLKEGKQVIIRFPVIPEITDTEENIDLVIKHLSPYHHITISPLEIHLLPFHSAASKKYLRFRMDNAMANQQTSSIESMERLSDRFRQAGFITKIGG
ncbi:glycyl-radical enzyme activating protein [Bacteroidota bacterium]